MADRGFRSRQGDVEGPKVREAEIKVIMAKDKLKHMYLKEAEKERR